MSRYIVTGAAGFIAARVVEMLLEAGHTVVGIDNLNNAYDVRLKEWRLERLQKLPGFQFVREDISDKKIIPMLKEHAEGLCRGHQFGCPGGSTIQRQRSMDLLSDEC